MARRARSGFSTVVNLMSQETKERLESAPTRVPLLSIRPDRGQPRIVLPEELAQALHANQLSPLQLCSKWLTEKKESRVLSELRQLADSIARHGLINAITVRKVTDAERSQLDKQVKYVIVTGERRYWAHCLLAVEGRSIQEGKRTETADEIKVSLVAEGVSIRAHQLIENITREDINAYEKAIGCWALRAELSNVPFNPELNFRGQKLVTWAQVEEALGISKRYRIYVTKTLKLAPEALALVQKYHLSERLIRPVVQNLLDSPSLQVKALEELIENKHTEQSVSSSTTRGLVNEATNKTRTPSTTQFQRKVRGTLRLFQEIDPKDKVTLTENLTAETVDQLRSLRDEIDHFLSQVKV